MANEITEAFRVAFPDGPSSTPTEPTKSLVRAIGPIIENKIGEVAFGIGSRLAHADRATTGNITLSGEQVIDGTLTAASRILVIYQTLPAANGLYVTGAGAWTRAVDANTTAELYRAAIYVLGGTVNAGNTFQCQIAETAVLGTDPCPWSLIDRSDISSIIGGINVSDQQLKDWTEAGSYEVTSVTGPPGPITTAVVKWPDGSAGTYTPTYVGPLPSSYTITHAASGKTVTQAAVTYTAGFITTKPALTVA